MTVGDETKTLGAGDVVVVNRGVEHELYSEGGMTFVEALAPVLARPRAGLSSATSCSVTQGDSLHVGERERRCRCR